MEPPSTRINKPSFYLPSGEKGLASYREIEGRAIPKIRSKGNDEVRNTYYYHVVNLLHGSNNVNR
jgi:hypothetical protein